jgi:hypothetical protein
MSQERLAELMRTHQQAIEAGHEPGLAHEAVLSVLRGLTRGEVTRGQAIRLLRYQALVAETPAYATIYRQAAAALWQMPRGER